VPDSDKNKGLLTMTNWCRQEGSASPLGATWIAEDAFNFALYSMYASEVKLLLIRERMSQIQVQPPDQQIGAGLALPAEGCWGRRRPILCLQDLRAK
jgi:pullulanase/glycogen debranching enzyme